MPKKKVSSMFSNMVHHQLFYICRACYGDNILIVMPLSFLDVDCRWLWGILGCMLFVIGTVIGHDWFNIGLILLMIDWFKLIKWYFFKLFYCFLIKPLFFLKITVNQSLVGRIWPIGMVRYFPWRTCKKNWKELVVFHGGFSWENHRKTIGKWRFTLW